MAVAADAASPYPSRVPALQVLDGAAVRRWCAAAADALGAAREQINALNVFPVADRDTGTNLHLTMLSAARALGALPPESGPREVWHALAHGILLGAQGNSGIIVSQFMRGLADICAPASRCDGAVVREGLAHAARLSREAVGQPVEGTVLTVAAAAAEAAQTATQTAEPASAVGAVQTAEPAAERAAQVGAGVSNDLAAVTVAAADGARQALMRTTAQLDVLARAGVVDAGAAGLCLILDALAAVATGTVAGSFAVPSPAAAAPAAPGVPSPAAAAPAAPGVPSPAAAAPVRPAGGDQVPASGQHGADRAGYEVMYLLEAADAEVARLRDRLGELGDSVVVVGGAGLWNVHVHVADAGAAIEAGLAAGRPRRIRVNYLATLPTPAELAGRCAADEPALAAHDWLAAHDEVPGTPDGRSSATSGDAGFGGDVGAVADVAAATRWGEVLWRSAEGAAAATGAATAGHAPHGAGDAVGRIGDDAVASGADATAVAVSVAERLLAAGGDLVTLIAGSFARTSAPDGSEVADVVAARLEETRPGVKIIIREGGGPGCLLAIGVGRAG